MFKPGDLVTIEHTKLFESYGRLDKALYSALVVWESFFLDTYICAKVLPIEGPSMYHKIHILGIRKDGEKSQIGRDSFILENSAVVPFVVDKNFIDLSYYI